MTSRALIIAIEDYRQASGMIASKLDHVVEFALRFREWVEDKWAREKPAATQMIFCSEPRQPGGDGASWDEIVSAVEKLEQEGHGMTDELFVFFSGHGFQFKNRPGELADVLVASDFSGRGNVCLRLDEIVKWLRAHLGGSGTHYYFIDACRNIITPEDLGKIGDAFAWKPKVGDETSLFMIQSTVSGMPALVAGPFAESLHGGLFGEGASKVWVDEVPLSKMVVHFSSLYSYLAKKLKETQPITQTMSGQKSPDSAVINILNPPPDAKLSVIVAGLEGRPGKFTLKRSRDFSTHEIPLEEQLVVPCAPDRYQVHLAADGVTFLPGPTADIDLGQGSATLTFLAMPADGGPPEPPGPSLAEHKVMVGLEIPDRTNIELRGIDSGLNKHFGHSETLELPPGRYETTLRSNDGVTLRRSAVEIGRLDDPTGVAEDILKFAPADWTTSKPRRQIAEMFPSDQANTISFSESLGGMDDPDLNLWLTLLGAGRIIGSRADYTKIAAFPLMDFTDLAPKSSGIYILAGFEQDGASIVASFGPKADARWYPAEAPPGLTSLRHLWLDTPPANGLLRLQIGPLQQLKLATSVMPNRITLVVITLDSVGAPIVNQFILPVGHLIPYMEKTVRQQLECRNNLRDVKFIAQLARAYRKGKKFRDEFTTDQLDQLLYAKWTDPIGAALAAYEKLRRHDYTMIPEVVKNMVKYFPGFPDSAAISHMFSRKNSTIKRPDGIPIFLDGWLATREQFPVEQRPEGNLDYSASFSIWWGP